MSYQVLARKWRPKIFDDMVGQSHVLKALSNALDQDRLHHAYLFTGTRGVGKTTLARIFAKCLNCEKGVSSKPCGECNACASLDQGRFIDLIEVDAASRSKVDETRDLMENVQYAPTSGRFKVYLIDEIHMFSGHSFNALLKTLEEPPPHVKFLLATTEHKKVPITILSRCLQFNLNHLTVEQIIEQIEKILVAENIKYDKKSVELISICAAGSVRDALSLLDQAISFGNGALKEDQVRTLMGMVENEDINGLLQSLVNSNPDAMLDVIEKISSKNPDYNNLLSELLRSLHKIAILQILPEDSSHIRKTDETLLEFANAMTKEEAQLYYQIGMMGRKDFYLSPDPKTGLEMIMIRMLAFNPSGNDLEIKKKQIIQTTKNVDVINKEKPVESNSQDQSKGSDGDDPNSTWEDIINEMELVGFVEVLARNCILQSQDNEKVKLLLSPDSENLLTPELNEKLEEAIKKRFGNKVKLIIVIEESNHETPFDVATRLKKESKNIAKESVKNDPLVKNLQDTFDATIDKVRPQ